MSTAAQMIVRMAELRRELREAAKVARETRRTVGGAR